MRALRTATEFTLPAVPASFDTGSSRRLETSSLPVASTSSKEEDFDIEAYKDATPESSKLDANPKRKAFSEALTSKPKTVINFSECKVKNTWSSCELTKESTEPSAKRRKFKILPVEFNTNVSTASTSNGATGKSEETTKGAVAKKPVNDDKKELGKSYLKEVKRTLSEQKYKIFGAMIQSYTKNADFDELLRTLEILFPADEKLQHLFVGKNPS